MRTLLLGMMLSLLVGCARDPGPTRIILIVVDTLRRDHISPYGSEIATPNIQRLADEGQVFTQALASFHQTTMSMGALFTGHTPSIESGDTGQPLTWTGRTWCGMSRFAQSSDDSCVPQGLTTLAERLRSAGYATIGVVSNRLLFEPAGFAQGFDTWREVGSPRTNLAPRRLVPYRAAPYMYEVVRRETESLPDGKVFLYVHYLDVHDWTAVGRPYAAVVADFDADLGRLMELLRRQGLLEDAVVVFTADHGEVLGEANAFGGTTSGHKGNPSLESVLEIPLIVVPPQPRDENRMIRSQDIAELIAEVAGLPALPSPREEAVSEDELFLTEARFLTYRKGRWKSTFDRQEMSRGALFDLEADPDERVNLIQQEGKLSAEHLARARELAKRLGRARAGADQLTDEDRERLRALGYLE